MRLRENRYAQVCLLINFPWSETLKLFWTQYHVFYFAHFLRITKMSSSTIKFSLKPNQCFHLFVWCPHFGHGKVNKFHTNKAAMQRFRGHFFWISPYCKFSPRYQEPFFQHYQWRVERARCSVLSALSHWNNITCLNARFLPTPSLLTDGALKYCSKPTHTTVYKNVDSNLHMDSRKNFCINISKGS